MEFLKNWLKNLGLLLIIGIILFLMFPAMMKQVFEAYGMIFGPLIFVMILVYSLPRKGKRRN